MSSDNQEAELATVFKQAALEASGTAGDGLLDKADSVASEPADEAGQAEPEGEAPQSEAAAQQPAANEISDDVWADAPAHLREAFEAERTRAQKAENLARSHSGRLSRLDRELNALRQSGASTRDAAAATPKGEEATDGDERMKQLREEYPELAEPILAKMSSLEATIRDLKSAEDARASERTDQYLQQQREILTERHPDWMNVIETPEFAAWRDSQPSYVQHAITHSVDGADTADILSRFKAETGDAGAASAFTARRAQQLQGGRSVPAKAPGVSAKSDDPQALWKQAVAERRALTR